MASIQSLIADFDTVLITASDSRRMTILRQVTDLFVDGAASYSDDQVVVFGVVIALLMEKVDQQALIELSGKLTPIDNAPSAIIGRLARNNDLAIAGAILEKSNALMDKDIVDIAGAKGPDHLLAVAGRKQIGEAITDALIGRGIPDIPEVLRRIVGNEHARISHVGFVKLLNAAKRDPQLAKMIASRGDMPAELEPFLKLIA